MTTTVKVTAQCDDKTEVEVYVGDFETEEVFEKHTLQNDEWVEVHCYDNRAVAVRERAKDKKSEG